MAQVSIQYADSLKKLKCKDCVARFVFGGIVTVLAGLIAHFWGPVVGGLFLSFPAIFPASATLVEKHEKQKEEDDGQPGKSRGIRAAGVDAAGAALATFGLMAFGAIIWWLAPTLPTLELLACAMASWIAVSVAAWTIRQKV